MTTQKTNVREQKKLLGNMTDRAHRRQEKSETIQVEKLPNPALIGEYALLGVYSSTLPQSKRRIVTETLPLTEGISDTPTAVARDYLREIYKRGPRHTYGQELATKTRRPEPNVATPSVFDFGAYVDIKSCYWSIMQIVGWDADYYPEKWLCTGRPPYDYPFADHKISRNSLVSAGEAGAIPAWHPNKWEKTDHYGRVKAGSELRNRLLKRLIEDVLNCIADEAIDAGAVYVNKDGFIAPDHNSIIRVCNVIEEWGLEWSIKAEGAGEVRSSGAYKIGAMVSGHYKFRQQPHPISELYVPRYRKWLKEEFTFVASK
jgi:hypothetical protein